MSGKKKVVVAPYPRGRDQDLSGHLICPPDKSVTHRSVMFAGMAKGVSRILNPLMGADCRSTIGVFRALGVSVAAKDDSDVTSELIVDSPGWDAWQSPLIPLDYGNSGTTARLLTGIFAATPGLFITAFGDQSLVKRPMGRVVEPLRKMGARIAGRSEGHLLPHAIDGTQLAGGAVHVVDNASAQVKSALILAGLNTPGTTLVTLPAGGRDHSEKMLVGLGATVHVTRHGALEEIAVTGPFRPQAGSFSVPGDPSSAAFFAVLGALAGGSLEIRGMLDNPTRTGFVTAMERMGAKFATKTPIGKEPRLEPIIDLTVSGGVSLVGADHPPEAAPAMIDEIPVLAVLAAFATGQSRFRGLGELRVKESDRLAKTLELLHAGGAKAETEGDDLIVFGGLKRATAFTYDPDEDHRLAMAAAVMAKFADGPCTVLDPSAVAVSFPGFFDVLAGLC